MVNTITKEEISKLPIATFPGEIVIIDKIEDVEKAVKTLKEYNLLGFDTETRPSFQKGKTHKISLIQISTDTCCYLFRINKTTITDSLRSLLTDPQIKLVGVSLKDDFSAIRKRISINQENSIELQSYVKKFGIEDNSLQKIYAILFGEKISKSQRLSNWDAESLTEGQQKYAALDAWACLRIYKKLSKLDFNLTDSKEV